MGPAATRAVEFLYQALAAPIGIALATQNPVAAKALIYSARSAAADPALMGVTIMVSPRDPQSEIWMIKSEGTLVARGRPKGKNKVTQLDAEITKALGLEDDPT